VKVNVTVVAEAAGCVERMESGRTTSSELEDREKSEPVGRGLPFTKTAVVQIKFVPER
jgi:hypothetical protein